MEDTLCYEVHPMNRQISLPDRCLENCIVDLKTVSTLKYNNIPRLFPSRLTGLHAFTPDASLSVQFCWFLCLKYSLVLQTNLTAASFKGSQREMEYSTRFLQKEC